MHGRWKGECIILREEVVIVYTTDHKDAIRAYDGVIAVESPWDENSLEPRN